MEKPKQSNAEEIKQIANKTTDIKLKKAINDKAKQIQSPVLK